MQPDRSHLPSWLQIPSAGRWHVAPWVDTLAYAFSWAPFLAVVAFVGDSHRRDYLATYLVVLAFTDVHRHYGLPYVYLDRAVFRQHALRFTLFPLLMLAAFVASPLLSRADVDVPVAMVGGLGAMLVLLVHMLRRDRADAPPRTSKQTVRVALTMVACALLPVTLIDAPTVRVRSLLDLTAVFAGAWNIWHVYMQKYGIFRMYVAKAGATERVPGWVDRLLVFSWLPLTLLYLGTTYHRDVDRLFSQGRNVLAPLFDTIDVVAPVAMIPAAGLVVASIALWLHWERRAHGLRNAPRLAMGLGTTMLAASFLLVHPLKAYLAYAMSHAVEYMVFVWAFQRRRYREPLPHRPLIARFLRYPITAYVLSAVALGALFTYWKYYGRWIDTGARMPTAGGFTTYAWVGYWTVYQSMVHFYFDGFLWKMRSPEIRATVGAE